MKQAQQSGGLLFFKVVKGDLGVALLLKPI